MPNHGTVEWSETDASGWIHFTAPQKWAENAEHQLCRSLDPSISVGAFPRKEIHSTFQRPLRAGQDYRVDIRPERIGLTSITYIWTVVSEDRVCVEGGHTVVHLGLDGRPAALPEALRTGLEHLTIGEAL